MKNLSFLTFLLLFLINSGSAQDYASDRGAFIVNGLASYTSSGGDLYERNDKRATSLMFSPSIDYFLLRNFFVGGALAYSKENDGFLYERTFAAGPEVGYVLGNAESKILPLVSMGYLFAGNKIKFADYPPGSVASVSGDEFFIAAGVIIPVQKHVGLTFGCMFRKQNYRGDYNISGDVIGLTIGINGLLYKTQEQE